jgi:hypothetical protein
MTFQKPDENAACKSLIVHGRRVSVGPFDKHVFSERS